MSEYIIAVLKGSVRLPNSSACQAYAHARFDWSVIAHQTRKVYEEVG